MEILRKIKKIVPVALTGLLLMGVTAGAGISDFTGENYKDNSLIVAGSHGLAADVIGATDIALALQQSAQTCTTEEISTVFEGDKVEVSESSDLLEIGEALGSVKETLTEDDLEGLEGGEINTGEGTTDYNQYIRLEGDGFTGGTVVYGEDEDNIVGDFLYFDDGEPLYEYEIEFPQGLESEIDDDELEDLENEDLVILGQTYTIVKADIDTSSEEVDLTLLGGSQEFILEEGEIKTYTIDGTDYEVEVSIISDADDDEDREVKFIVNGELIDEMHEGDTEELSDGTLIGVREILNNEVGEGSDLVEGFIGANKLELSDDYSDSDFTSGIDVNDESIEDGEISIRGFVNSDNFEITSIKYRVLADGDQGDLFVPAGNGVREFLDEPEGMLGNMDIVYEGLDDTGISEIVFNPKGDDEYDLHFENFNGLSYNIPLISLENFFDGVDPLGYGDSNDRLVFVEGANATDYNIPEDSYVILTDENTEDGITRVVRYDSIDPSDNEIDFDDLEAGNLQYSYEGTEGVDAEGEIIVGGNTFKFFVGPAPDYELAIDLLGDGSIDGGQADIVVRGGGILNLGTTVISSSLNFTLTTLASEFDDTTGGDEEVIFNLHLVGSDELDIDVEAGVDTFSHDDNDDLESGMTPYGVYVEEEDNNNDADELRVEYPLTQRGANVAVVMGDVEEISTETTCTALGETVDHALDVDVESHLDHNLILVGGPCANTLSSSLFMTCDEWALSEGEYLLQLVEMGENVAVLVAGTTAEDTQSAVDAFLAGETPTPHVELMDEVTTELEE